MVGKNDVESHTHTITDFFPLASCKIHKFQIHQHKRVITSLSRSSPASRIGSFSHSVSLYPHLSQRCLWFWAIIMTVLQFLSLSISVSISLSLFLCLCFSVSVSLSLSRFLPLSLSLLLTLTFCLFFCLSLSLDITWIFIRTN